jgi:hypothetical protein
MPERAPAGQAPSIESRSGFTVPLHTEENEKKCPRLKEVEYSHPLYGDAKLLKLVLCSEIHDHRMEWLFTWNESKNGWDKVIVPCYTHYESIIPTEEAFEQSVLRELDRFESMRRQAKSRNMDLKEFLSKHRREKPAPKPRMKPLVHKELIPTPEPVVRKAVQEALKKADEPTGEKRPKPKCPDCGGPHAKGACESLPELDDGLFPDEM